VKKIILLADDDFDDQMLLSEALQLTNDQFELHAVSSGREAMAFLRNFPDPIPDLVILDYNMPDNNGAEVLDMINSNDELRKIPVLVWSTSDSLIYKRICAEKGARSYFKKPNSFKDLLTIIRKMLTFVKA